MSTASFDYASWSPASSSLTSPSSSSPVHPASLVDATAHSAAIMQLINTDISRHFIKYVVECISDTVQYALGYDAPRGRTHARTRHTHRKFTAFVQRVLAHAKVRPAAALVTLVYVARAHPHLSIAHEEWALERVFLGALVAASKYTQDSTLKNAHWARVSGLFDVHDVGRIEREFLEVLDWELGVREEEVVVHWAGILGESARQRERRDLRENLAVQLSPVLQSHVRLVRLPQQQQVQQVPDLVASPTSTCVSLSPRTPFQSGTPPQPHVSPTSKHDSETDADPARMSLPVEP
ncbi:unnamed protein product [Mycena citricolor]|uniref:Cyclin N-terminal domain-containing protein n=1 Tax=Mycena citricolor TaxID=2018698 RepID=A0AAD2GZP9_9AGAR|nr:unnamed protein product [Mycena citricolor]